MSRTVIETARLRLRTWEAEDLAEFARHTNTPAVMHWLGGVMDDGALEALYGRITACQQTHGHCFWLVERKADGALLGFCGIKRVDAPGTDLTGRFEIGWRLREDAWGMGYAREAAAASLDYAFAVIGAPEVVAFTVAGNRASWGLMQRLGMERRTELDFVDPRYRPDLNPTIVYSLKSADWSGL